MPAPIDSATVTASTCQFSVALTMFPIRRVSPRIPHAEKPTPSKPPNEESKTDSVKSCRTTRRRAAPILSRTAISRRRAVERASKRFAMLAQAIARMRATIAMSTYSGFEILAPQKIQSSGTVLQKERGQICALPVVDRARLDQTLEAGGHRRLRLFTCDTGPEASHH